MAKITVTIGDLCLDHIDDIDPAAVLAAGDAAIERLARQLGHSIEIDHMRTDSRGPRINVETSSFDAYRVEKRLRERFEQEWQHATDRAIEEA